MSGSCCSRRWSRASPSRSARRCRRRHAQEHAGATASRAGIGTTQGWFNGRTVTFLYTRPYSCVQPPSSGADSGCEVGADPQSAPIGNPDIPELWVVVPLGFTPPQGTLQCPVAGNCIGHPHDIDLSRVFGAGTQNVALPAHSHVIDDLQGGWWKTFVVGVTTQAAWDRIVAGRDLATVRELQQEGLATGDIPSNLFIFFNVLP
ncbi:MAG TPA: hypothetical protein VGM21_14505 [Actinomycetota bacterium]